MQASASASVLGALMLIPDVRVGDTLHIVYSVTGDNPVFAARFSDSASWDQTEPTERRRVTLLAPANRKIAWRMHGDYRSARVRPEETRLGDLRVLHSAAGGAPATAWRLRGLPRLVGVGVEVAAAPGADQGIRHHGLARAVGGQCRPVALGLAGAEQERQHQTGLKPAPPGRAEPQGREADPRARCRSG